MDEERFHVSGINPEGGPPFHWYVIEDGVGEVAYCQTENGEQHARMICAALNDRYKQLAADLKRHKQRMADLQGGCISNAQNGRVE